MVLLYVTVGPFFSLIPVGGGFISVQGCRCLVKRFRGLISRGLCVTFLIFDILSCSTPRRKCSRLTGRCIQSRSCGPGPMRNGRGSAIVGL